MSRLISSYANFTKGFLPPSFHEKEVYHEQELCISLPRVRARADHCRVGLGFVNCEFFDGRNKVFFSFEHGPKVVLHMPCFLCFQTEEGATKQILIKIAFNVF